MKERNLGRWVMLVVLFVGTALVGRKAYADGSSRVIEITAKR
jgi:hypothetical protein